MADENQEEDLDLGIEEEGGSKKKLIIIIAAAVLLLVLGGGAALWFLSGDEESQDAESAETAQSESKEDGKGEADTDTSDLPAIYYSLDPVFVANLPPGGGAKMLQVGVNLRLRSPELLEFIKLNDPMIRHRLLNLFSVQEAAKLRDRAGKVKLQAEVLAEVAKIIEEQGGPGNVEAVFFISFVMQ